MAAKLAPPAAGLLDELQDALAQGNVARRVETLRRVTDLFLTGAVEFSEQQIALFDHVFQCLLRHIETSAKVLLAERLAAVDSAPRVTVRTLALDELIDVAGPVLSRSERLEEATLVEAAQSRGQDHLLAISTRRVLSRTVTDVLVERGNDQVLQNTAGNAGAELSERSFDTLIARAEANDELATCLGMRPTLPRHVYLQLVARASQTVRERLRAANPRDAEDVPRAVRDAAERARSASAGISPETEIARALVTSLLQDGRLDERQVATFAEQGRFDETSASLAALARVAVPTAETLMVESRSEGVMILAKVAGLSWPAAKAVIELRDRLSVAEPTDLKSCRDTYEALRTSTAQQVLRFHRMQTAPA